MTLPTPLPLILKESSILKLFWQKKIPTYIFKGLFLKDTTKLYNERGTNETTGAIYYNKGSNNIKNKNPPPLPLFLKYLSLPKILKNFCVQ